MVINIWGKKYKKINKYLFYSTAATSRFFPCHDTSVVFIYSCQSRALKYLFALKMEGLDRLLKNASALSKELPRIRSEFNRFFRKKKKNVQSYYGQGQELQENHGSTNSSRRESPFEESLIFPDFLISPLWAPLESLQFLISERDGEVAAR